MAQLVCPQTAEPQPLESAIAKLLRWEAANPTSSHSLTWESALAAPFYYAVGKEVVADVRDALPDGSAGFEDDAAKVAWLAIAPTLTDAENEALDRWIIRAHNSLQFNNHPDLGSHTQILRDTETRFGGGPADVFTREYAKTLPPGWRESVILCLRSGEPVIVVRWTAERERIEDIRAWADATELDAQGCGRWEALDDLAIANEGYTRVPIAPSKPVSADAHAARARLQALAAPVASDATSAAVHTTGVAALDAVLETGGVPARGARCVIQAPTANAKTTVALEIAEHYAACGLGVVWIATRDEPRESLIARRHQRAGRTRAEAIALARAGDESGLCDQLLVVDGTAATLEDMLDQRAGFDVLFIDPLQKVRMRSGGSGAVGSVEAALELIELSGVTTWMTSAFVRGGTRRRARLEMSKGGAAIENGATLLLDLERAGDALTVRVLKSRYGGEDAELALTLDRERQRVHSSASSASQAEARIRADVLTALALSPGQPRTRSWLETTVTGRAVAIRATVKAMVADGTLTECREGVRQARPRE